jgi:hypothetical protein
LSAPDLLNGFVRAGFSPPSLRLGKISPVAKACHPERSEGPQTETPSPKSTGGKMKLIALAILTITLTSATRAQTPTPSAPPTANPSDVKSIDSILTELYAVISGPAGDRDWNRFRSLFAKGARLTSVTKEASDHPVRLLSPDDYINLAGDYFKTHAFYEKPIVNKVDRFGNIAQVFSSYESRNAPGEKPFARGINSIQLFYDQDRWWVLSILWDEETPENPLPANLATRTTAPVTQ